MVYGEIYLSSIFKGILLLAIFIVLIRKNKLYPQPESIRNFKEEIASSTQE